MIMSTTCSRKRTRATRETLPCSNVRNIMDIISLPDLPEISSSARKRKRNMNRSTSIDYNKRYISVSLSTKATILSQFKSLMILTMVMMIASNCRVVSAQQQQDPLTMNGGSLLAMAGNQCVALAVDKRFGSGPQMVNIAPRHVWSPHPNIMLGFVGLETDVQTLSRELKVQIAATRNRALGLGTDLASRRITPSALAHLTSHVLYSKRGYYVEPIVVGLTEETHQPFLCSMDMIGALSFSKQFVVSGAASKSLYGTAEALWRDSLEPDDLAEVCGKAFQSALERDCYSGYGILVYLITRDGIVEYDLSSRND